ncbi:MAG: rhomboid family intramembrane serine protease [Candidatus Woesearchaeota archaeon]
MTPERIKLFERFGLLFLALSVVYVVLFIMPGVTDLLLLDPDLFLSGEFWRIFTYPLVHQNLAHLSENIIALFLSILLAIELKSSLAVYSSTYVAAGIFAILPLWILSPFLALGASAAIYGSFGFLSRSASRFDIKPYALLSGIAGFTVVSAVYSHYSGGSIALLSIVQQLMAHLAGLMFGYYFCILATRAVDKYFARRITCLRSMN